MRAIFATLAVAAGLWGAGIASAQCVVTGPPPALTATCPGGTGLLSTGPGGVVTGFIGGQPFVGQQVAPGVLSGSLNGAPFPATPDLNAAVPGVSAAPPAVGAPPPALSAPPLPEVPVSRPYLGTAATRAAAQRRAEYLRRLRETEAAAQAR